MPELPYGANPVPVTPIGELGRWWLDIRCSRCRRQAALPVDDLIGRYGEMARISHVVSRLRCSGLGKPCHAIPAQVVLVEVDNHGSSGRRLREVVVIARR